MPNLACGHSQEAIGSLLNEILRFRELTGNSSCTLEQLAMKSGKQEEYWTIASCYFCHETLQMRLDEFTEFMSIAH